jgi:hypothetical protein
MSVLRTVLKDTSKDGAGEGFLRQLYYLDDQVRNVALWAVWKATLWSDYVPRGP